MEVVQVHYKMFRLMQFAPTLAFAKELDENDCIREFRDKFIIPTFNGKQAIYFLGNSLGLQPKNCSDYISQVLKQWGQLGVEGFFKGTTPWMKYHNDLAACLSSIVGALPSEITVMNSLTVNIHLMLSSFYSPSAIRNKIICESKAFPSDQYALETHLKQRGLDPDEVIIELQPAKGEATIAEDTILHTIEEYKDEVALVFLGGVNYYTGQVFNIPKITKAAHTIGAIAAFDLAHAAGNIFLDLHNWDVDFACWCSYKYLNSGPGGVAGCFIHKKYHYDNTIQRLAGWWGYEEETRFKMYKEFNAAKSAEGWQVSTPSAILYATHKASLDIFKAVDFQQLISKSQQLTDYLLFLIEDLNASFNKKVISVLTPTSAKGCQLSLLLIERGREICNSLTARGVFADWREPGVIRIAPVPLYNTFEDVWRFVEVLKQLISGDNIK